MVNKKIYISIVLLVLLSFVSGDEAKGSLTFVIDDTLSMEKEINQVKASTEDIFEAVLSSNASRIDEFIIVTFNDPEAKFRVKTKNNTVFKNTLSEIKVGGGGDCPEAAMAGIELAIDSSKPNSFLYAFTDAAAKDHEKYEYVKSLALQKSIQVNFLLTGECNKKKTKREMVVVYDRLAAATSGQVLHIRKVEISEIIKYVLANLRSRRTVLLHKTYGNMNKCDNVKFTVDSKLSEIMIALSSPENLVYEDLALLGPDDKVVPIDDFINTGKTAIFKLEGNPGEYSIQITNCKGITVVVSASTSVSFLHGFSSVKPSSLEETSTNPDSGNKSYLAIALQNDKRDVTLKTVEIRDMDDNLIPKTLPLTLVDKEKQFYITDLFTPPYEMFKIAVIGQTEANEKITMMAQTSIEYRKPKPKETPPTVTILGPKQVLAEYNGSVTVKCKVNGFPLPQIVWESEFHTDGKTGKVNEIAPNEFISVLDIKGVTKNVKFICKAKNYKLEDYVTVMVKKKDVLEYPTEIPEIDKHINSYTAIRNSTEDIKCRVIKGEPKPVIVWSFDRGSLGNFRNLDVTGETVHIDRVTANTVGTYRCEVSNEFGNDRHEMQLYMEYPPTVSIERKNLESENGKQVKIACRVDGSPTPNVRWYIDNVEIYSGRKYKIYRNHTLSFTGAIQDSGNYSCEASNHLATARAQVTVLIYERVKIEIPEKGTFDAPLKSTLVLPCHATGYPKPTVIWSHYPFKSTVPKKIKWDTNNSAILQNIQLEDEGYYKCTADNILSKDSFTYNVSVPAGATIIRNHVSNKIQLVEGDMYFNLTCESIGSPKPTITWTVDEIKIGIGGGFKVLNDGSLLGYNATSRHKGTYTCKAENKNGVDIMDYEVDVQPLPAKEVNPPIIILREGEKRFPMFCGIVLEYDFFARWFKDGKLIKTHLGEGNITFFDVKKSDAGYYDCRVNTPRRSYTYTYVVIVGTPPTFTRKTAADQKVDLIEYKHGARAILDCRATGDPQPMTNWLYDNVKIGDANSSQYAFTMNIHNIGHYTCSVSNEFGAIKRNFEIIAGECLMNLENDFTARQPILVTASRKHMWPLFDISNGSLRMQKLRKFKLYCPDSFISYNDMNYGRKVETSCVGDSIFKLEGMDVKASEITCNKTIIPLAADIMADSELSRCLGHNTKILYIGFDLDGPFKPVFSVCFNETVKTPLFVNHGMHKDIAGTIPKQVAGYTRGARLSLEYEEIYNCSNQMDAISSFTGKISKSEENCCFKRRQLVNPRDVLPGISQVATYHYLNVVPQWSTCGTENWDEVERRVRNYVLNSKGIIQIWTGATSVRKSVAAINLTDNLNREQLQVPQYIWKIVGKLIAIVHVNVPGLTSSEASSYILCNNICDTIDWMKNSQWLDVHKGFIYCCTKHDFEKAFDYEYIFKD